jgi:hypothetical protein
MSVDPNMLALQGMMSGPTDPMMQDPMAMPPMEGDMDMGMDMGMGSDVDPMGVTEIPVPNWAVPAVIELIALLEQGMGEEGGMGEDMMPAGDEMMMDDMGPMM